MVDIGLLNQGLKWLQSQNQAIMGAQMATRCIGDRICFLIDNNWPSLYNWCLKLGGLLLMLLAQWRDCVVRGSQSLIGPGMTAFFIILWSCLLCLTSMSCFVYVLLILGAAGATIRYLGCTPGLSIVGLFGILTIWIYGNFWIVGMLFIVGGYIFSHNHARPLIFISTAYSVYYVYVHVGWIGVFLSTNLSFLSNDLFTSFLQGYDCMRESEQCEESAKSEPIAEEFSEDCDFCTQTSEAEDFDSPKSCKTSSTQNVVNIKVDPSPSKVLKSDSSSLDEMKRIMNSSNHYEALGFPRNIIVDPTILKKEYRRKAVLVHPDKNMGNPLASESFKKLQCAYEVLSDITKKRDYDVQLRKEESRIVSQMCRSSSQQAGVEYRSEESRCVDCTKCGNSHLWICTNRSKVMARWCQDCRQYHQARDGEGWVELGCSTFISSTKKVEIPRAFVCAESKIFDVSEWAICQVSLIQLSYLLWEKGFGFDSEIYEFLVHRQRTTVVGPVQFMKKMRSDKESFKGVEGQRYQKLVMLDFDKKEQSSPEVISECVSESDIHHKKGSPRSKHSDKASEFWPIHLARPHDGENEMQGMACRANTHRPSFRVSMVGLDKRTQRSNPAQFPCGLDAEMMSEDEDDFELWFQQALASGVFSETSQRRKSWSPFKISQKNGIMKQLRRFS